MLENPLSFSTVGFETLLALTITLAGTVVVADERRGGRVLESDAVGVDRTDAIDVLAVAAGAGVAYLLSVPVGLGPVVASAVVGVIAGVGFAEIDVPIYCGSFVGMVSPSVIPSLEYVGIAGLVAGLAFVATTEAFGGFGGKLGTIALFGCASTVALTGLEYAAAGSPAWDLAWVVVPVAIVGAVGTVLLSRHLQFGAVVGSGAVGLGAGLGFPALAPDIGSTLAAVAFCASFVGMSSPDRLATAQIAGAGAASGLLYLTVRPAFVGAGGKLGTVAFASCLTLAGIGRLSESVSARIGQW
ncbi:hypothetical protein ATJ93_1449 [Halopiger aswanensis]|uniref:Uncharacterized protein n=1 Tax=Halopiger aswanensis TaxID=148449 RepID=A0A3R7DG44_9EURY|nr:hypothetical protein ATJ93_1449 [Halopiger aswanensis]